MTARRCLVLVGAGHAHAEVLKDWGAAPVAGVDVVLVSPSALAPYSGRVPAWLAGAYEFEEICIDFAALARAAGAAFVPGEVTRLDPDARRVTLACGRVLAYDLLSLDIGSTMRPPPGAADVILPMRPIGALSASWQRALARLSATSAEHRLSVTAVGGGAAGVESLLAVLARLRALLPGRRVEGSLVTRSLELLPGMARGASRRARLALHRADVAVQLACDPCDAVTRSDLVLWATGAEAHPWPAAAGLAADADGFVRVDRHLRSLSHPDVLAAGDCVAWPGEPLPKAGVFAVRMGPVLSCNLRASLGRSETLVGYVPQRRHLALLSTADGRAIAAWGRWSASGRWAQRWKERIDRRFMARFLNAPSC